MNFIDFELDEEYMGLNNKNKAEKLNTLGINYGNDSKYVDALKCFLEANNILPNEVAIQNNIKTCLNQLKEINQLYLDLCDKLDKNREKYGLDK